MPITAEKLVAAVRRVVDADAVLAPQLAVLVLEVFNGTDSLTTLEREVVLLIASGYSYEETAARLHLSAGTIEARVSTVLSKLPI